MLWATPSEVDTYLTDAYPDDTAQTSTQSEVDKAVRALTRVIIRWPELDATEPEDDQRPEDAKVKAAVVAAVAETIRDRRRQKAADDDLSGSGPGAASLLRDGGSISTDDLTVTGPRTSSGNATGTQERRLPLDAVDALSDAGMIGGSVAAW